MNHNSDHKSSKKKINPVDAVIAIIFVLALVAAVYLTVTIAFDEDASSVDSSQTQVEYRLCVANVDVERFGITLDEQTGTAKCDFLQIGDLLYSADGSIQIGKLSSIQYEITTGSTGVTDSEGNLIYAEYPGRVNLILTVRGESEMNSVSMGDQSIRVGGEISFHTPDYTATAEVLSVETEVK